VNRRVDPPAEVATKFGLRGRVIGATGRAGWPNRPGGEETAVAGCIVSSRIVLVRLVESTPPATYDRVPERAMAWDRHVESAAKTMASEVCKTFRTGRLRIEELGG